MIARVVRRARARRDIVETALYLEERSPKAALRFVAAVEETVTALAAAPMIGVTRAYRDPALAGLRMLPVHRFAKYLIFYRPTKNGIEIVRVLHGARDVAAVLAKRGSRSEAEG